MLIHKSQSGLSSDAAEGGRKSEKVPIMPASVYTNSD